MLRLLAAAPGFDQIIDAQGPFNGYTPLHDAVWHGHTYAAQVLIEAGARTDLAGHDGKTPIELAHEFGYQDIVTMLSARDQR